MFLMNCFVALQCLPRQSLRVVGKNRPNPRRKTIMMTMRLVMKMMAVVMMMTSERMMTRVKKAMKVPTLTKMTIS